MKSIGNRTIGRNEFQNGTVSLRSKFFQLSILIARIVEFIPKVEKKEELIKAVRNEVLPILKKQRGFLA
jgi:hypothetical protein